MPSWGAPLHSAGMCLPALGRAVGSPQVHLLLCNRPCSTDLANPSSRYGPCLSQVVRVEPSPNVLAQAISNTGSNITKPHRLLLTEPDIIPDAPDWAKPNRSWVQRFVVDFQQLRLQVQEAYEQGGG